MAKDHHQGRQIAVPGSAPLPKADSNLAAPSTVIHAVPKRPGPVSPAPLHERLAAAVRDAERASSPDAQALNAILVPLSEACHRARTAEMTGDVARALAAEIAAL